MEDQEKPGLPQRPDMRERAGEFDGVSPGDWRVGGFEGHGPLEGGPTNICSTEYSHPIGLADSTPHGSWSRVRADARLWAESKRLLANHDALVRYALALEARIERLESAGAALADAMDGPRTEQRAALSAWASAVGKPEGGA